MDETAHPTCRCGEAIVAALEGVLELARRQPAPLLTLEQAAERLGVDPATLARWVSRKQVSHTRLGGGKTVRFTEQDLADIVAAGARRVSSTDPDVDADWAHVASLAARASG